MSLISFGSQILTLALKDSRSWVHPTYITFSLLSSIFPELDSQGLEFLILQGKHELKYIPK